MADTTVITDVEQMSVTFDADRAQSDSGGGLGYAFFLPPSVDPTGIDPWWTFRRDSQLLDFFRRVDPLKIAVNTFVSKALAVPLHFSPLEQDNKTQLGIADEAYNRLVSYSDLMRGFKSAFRKFLFDYLTQDNGGFLYIYADGSNNQPIVGLPYGLEHLPSQRCIRTANPEFPVRFTHANGKSYPIHFTRIIELANLPSTDPMRNGVGHCPITLCLDAAQELRDISVFSQEKLGSRPQRQIVYAKTGATIGQLTDAFYNIDLKLSSNGLTRFSKTGLLAPKLPGGKLELDVLDLASAPDGFDRQTVVMLDMATIAAAFGLDLRDLAYSFGISGQTKSDAEVQHEKGFGKGVAEVLGYVQEQLTEKYLPEHIIAHFDYIDDTQDKNQADIRSVRTQSRTRDIMAGVATVRSTRLQMLQDREITQELFEQMELEDGRLVDGTEVFRLLYSKDTYYKQFLNFTSEFPQDVNSEENDPVEIISEVNENLVKVYEEFEAVGGTVNKARKLRQCMALLSQLKKLYIEKQQLLTNQTNMLQNMPNTDLSKTKPDDKPNNLLSPQARMNKVAGKGTQKGLPQKGGQNGKTDPLS